MRTSILDGYLLIRTDEVYNHCHYANIRCAHAPKATLKAKVSRGRTTVMRPSCGVQSCEAKLRRSPVELRSCDRVVWCQLAKPGSDDVHLIGAKQAPTKSRGAKPGSDHIGQSTPVPAWGLAQVRIGDGNVHDSGRLGLSRRRCRTCEGAAEHRLGKVHRPVLFFVGGLP